MNEHMDTDTNWRVSADLILTKSKTLNLIAAVKKKQSYALQSFHQKGRRIC